MKRKGSLLLICAMLLISGCEGPGRQREESLSYSSSSSSSYTSSSFSSTSDSETSSHSSHSISQTSSSSSTETSSESEIRDYLIVRFETCTEEETNVIDEQHLQIGSLVEEPALVFVKHPEIKLRVEGWYKESSYIHKWNFLTDSVTEDLVLYAHWKEVITINYYLRNNPTPVYVAKSVFSGQSLPLHDELSDGYKLFGYYADAACTIPFDLNTPLTNDVNVYLNCDDHLYFNAEAIKRRFSIIAATGAGSKVGSISEVQKGTDGVEYVDINFGYSKTGDPHITLSNLSLDISKSQILKLKYKNFGRSYQIAFYWVSKYADGTYSANTQSYNESNVYRVAFSESEKNMSPDDPWLEKEFNLSSVIVGGLSTWGNSTTLVNLRIQFEYISASPDDLSNVIRLASIEGIEDGSHGGTSDSDEVKQLLGNDDEEALNEVASSQSQNIGVIFPKNNNLITNMSMTYYKKTNGLLMYGLYGSTNNRFVFNVSNQNINGKDYGNLIFKLRNYSYISSLSINIQVKNTDSGRTLSNKTSLTVSTRMSGFVSFNLPLGGLENMNGVVQTIQIMFSAAGVDNAVIIESATFTV